MKKILLAVLFVFFAGAAFAQSAEVVTEILGTSEATFGQVCYLSAVHQGLVSDSATYDESVAALYDKGQLPFEVNPSSPIALVDLAFVYSRIWNVDGGLLYRMTKGSPRYAYKQLKSDGVFSDGCDPSDILSGTEVLNIFTSCLFTYGGMTLGDIEE